MKTVSILLPQVEGVELKNATVDLKKGVVVAEYGKRTLSLKVKKGDIIYQNSPYFRTPMIIIVAADATIMEGINDMGTFIAMIGSDGMPYINGDYSFGTHFITELRFATKPEKQTLFEALKEKGKRYNPKTFEIEDVTKEEIVKKLEVGKDYVNVYDNNLIVIDRVEDIANIGFEGREYRNDLYCSTYSNWREATESEVIGAFKKHLTHRYGEDWETMKIKERHPASLAKINDGSWKVGIAKEESSWKVWNKNGLLYYDGIWVERLEEPKIHIKEAIKENTVIHCETEEEAERILGMAHELGYRWTSGEYYKNNTKWEDHKEKTCYNILNGYYGYVKYYQSNNQIIPSTKIADLEEAKLSDWVIAPEDVKEIKAGEKADNRYVLKRDVLIILSVESKLNPDKKLSEYLEQFKLILEVL